MSIDTPKQGKLSFTVEDTTQISYSHVDSVYADADGRVKEVLVHAGDEVQKGQCLMKFEKIDTGEINDIVAQDDGVITSVGVETGMYVSFMQNIILYEIAEVTEDYNKLIKCRNCREKGEDHNKKRK